MPSNDRIESFIGKYLFHLIIKKYRQSILIHYLAFVVKVNKPVIMYEEVVDLAFYGVTKN